ncbi:LysR family transcriptional regulator [Cupriavidus basilensis]
MKDHHLKAWLRLVETGSIRGAARSLHLSQAAITKAVKELEEDLDAPLIVRSSRGVTLTECGHQLTLRARMAQAQLTLARQDIRQLQGAIPRAWRWRSRRWHSSVSCRRCCGRSGAACLWPTSQLMKD